jgi:hypothetical protein
MSCETRDSLRVFTIQGVENETENTLKVPTRSHEMEAA